MSRIHVIDTQAVSPRDRLDYWNSAAGDKVAPVAVRTIGNASFEASLATRHLRSVSLLSLRATPSRVHTRAEAGLAGMSHLAISRSGSVLSKTGGERARLETNDLALYDHAKPMAVSYPEGVDLVVLRMITADLQVHVPMMKHLVGRKIPGTQGGAAVLARFLTGLWDQLLDPDTDDPDDDVEAVIWPMVQLAFNPASSEIARRIPSIRDRSNRLLGIVEARLCEADLKTETIASQLDMSPRSVQLAFAKMGVTPASYIRNRRLDLAASKLAAGGMAGVSVTDVCFEVGFNDLSSFCRNFRRRFGVSPSQFGKGQRPSRCLLPGGRELNRGGLAGA
jgi:AraC-like DNA-binding protein